MTIKPDLTPFVSIAKNHFLVSKHGNKVLESTRELRVRFSSLIPLIDLFLLIQKNNISRSLKPFSHNKMYLISQYETQLFRFR